MLNCPIHCDFQLLVLPFLKPLLWKNLSRTSPQPLPIVPTCLKLISLVQALSRCLSGQKNPAPYALKPAFTIRRGPNVKLFKLRSYTGTEKPNNSVLVVLPNGNRRNENTGEDHPWLVQMDSTKFRMA